jgi:spermidine/putrescine transport system substrate-binding protein
MASRSIRFLNWVDYVAPHVLARFEAETGVHVEETYFSTDAECVARVTAGESFDVVLSTDYVSAGLRNAGLLQPLDMERLPNWRHVTNQRLRQPPHDPETDGHKYTSVLYFGTEGFAVQIDKVARIRSSWEMLFDPAFKGEIAMVDGSREVLAPALFLLGSSPNTTDRELLDEATAMATEQRALVSVYDSDTPQQRIVDGVAIVHCWDGDVGRAISSGATQVRYILPQEGFSLWVDGPCIPVSARDPEAAHRFIDFLLEPEVAAANANYSGYHPVVAAAEPMIRSLVQRSLRPTEEQIEAGTFLDDLGEFSAAYEAAYARVLAGWLPAR